MIGLGYFWQELKKRIDQKIEERTRLIINGAASFEAYREQVAYISALNWVIDQARDIFGEKKSQTVTSEEE